MAQTLDSYFPLTNKKWARKKMHNLRIAKITKKTTVCSSECYLLISAHKVSNSTDNYNNPKEDKYFDNWICEGTWKINGLTDVSDLPVGEAACRIDERGGIGRWPHHGGSGSAQGVEEEQPCGHRSAREELRPWPAVSLTALSCSTGCTRSSQPRRSLSRGKSRQYR